jgi:hypothetical protein
LSPLPSVKPQNNPVLTGLNDEGVLPEVSYKRTIKAIHTKVLSDIKRSIVSKLLGIALPDINPKEETLPRLRRCVPTQVRFTYCKNLQTYQNLLGAALDILCPVCTPPLTFLAALLY